MIASALVASLLGVVAADLSRAVYGAWRQRSDPARPDFGILAASVGALSGAVHAGAGPLPAATVALAAVALAGGADHLGPSGPRLAA